jgi:hypothetical protein
MLWNCLQMFRSGHRHPRRWWSAFQRRSKKRHTRKFEEVIGNSSVTLKGISRTLRGRCIRIHPTMCGMQLYNNGRQLHSMKQLQWSGRKLCNNGSQLRRSGRQICSPTRQLWFIDIVRQLLDTSMQHYNTSRELRRGGCKFAVVLGNFGATINNL